MKLLRIWSLGLVVGALLSVSLAGVVSEPASGSTLYIGDYFRFVYYSGFHIATVQSKKIDISIGGLEKIYPNNVNLGSQTPPYNLLILQVKPEVSKIYRQGQNYYLFVNETLQDLNDPQPFHISTRIPIKLIKYTD